MLNEQKVRLAIIGDDAAAHFETWRQAAEQSWTDIQRSLDNVLDRLWDWIGPPSVPDQQAEIPV